MVSGFKTFANKRLSFWEEEKSQKGKVHEVFLKFFLKVEIISDKGVGGEGSTKATGRCFWRIGVLTSKLIINVNYSSLIVRRVLGGLSTRNKKRNAASFCIVMKFVNSAPKTASMLN